MLRFLDIKPLLTTCILVLSVAILKTKSPLITVIIITGFTISAALLIKLINHSSWLSMILFLVFVGGLIILFSYITSLPPNEPMSLTDNKNKPLFKTHLSLVTFAVAILFYLFTKIFPISSHSFSLSLSTMIFKIYSLILPLNLLLIMFYLLLTLLVMAALTLENAGRLRKLNFVTNNNYNR